MQAVDAVDTVTGQLIEGNFQPPAAKRRRKTGNKTRPWVAKESTLCLCDTKHSGPLPESTYKKCKVSIYIHICIYTCVCVCVCVCVFAYYYN